jgi:hypothetical protein
VGDPLSGAKALSGYLRTRPEWLKIQNDIDLKRAELERIQHDLELFGPSDNDKAARNRAVYFLLRVCQEIALECNSLEPDKFHESHNKKDISTGKNAGIHVFKLDVHQKEELVTALLECASMRDRAARDAILNQLPSEIKNTIPRHSVDRVDVNNTVSRCLNFESGISDLIAGLKSLEGNSLGMQYVEALLRRLGQ